jgi:hypothetical protein
MPSKKGIIPIIRTGFRTCDTKTHMQTNMGAITKFRNIKEIDMKGLSDR